MSQFICDSLLKCCFCSPFLADWLQSRIVGFQMCCCSIKLKWVAFWTHWDTGHSKISRYVFFLHFLNVIISPEHSSYYLESLTAIYSAMWKYNCGCESITVVGFLGENVLSVGFVCIFCSTQGCIAAESIFSCSLVSLLGVPTYKKRKLMWCLFLWWHWEFYYSPESNSWIRFKYYLHAAIYLNNNVLNLC